MKINEIKENKNDFVDSIKNGSVEERIKEAYYAAYSEGFRDGEHEAHGGHGNQTVGEAYAYWVKYEKEDK